MMTAKGSIPMNPPKTKPDPTLFSVNERPREWLVQVRITGALTLPIQADSEEEAEKKADAIISANDFEPDLDEIDEADIRGVYKSPPLYRALRDGEKIQTSHLQPGDQPREPDDRGF